MEKKRINRREFIRNATGVAMGTVGFPMVIPSSVLGKSGSVAPSNRLTIGSIGVGLMGMQDTKAFAMLPDVQVVAVCDVRKWVRDDAKKWIDQHYGNNDCSSYNDFRKIIARNDIDMIMNATPDHWHAIPSIMAIKSGKDVYCEKPLSLTIAEGRMMADTAKRYGAVTQVGTWQRSISQFQYAVKLVQQGYLGKVKVAKVGVLGTPESVYMPPDPIPEGFDYDMWLGQAPWTPHISARCHGGFRFNYDYSGGGLCDWGAHHIDIVQWAFGKDRTGPILIEGSGILPEKGVYRTALSYKYTCQYDDGLTMKIGTADPAKTVTGDDAINWGIRFEGEDGRWLHVTRQGLETHPANLKKDLLQNDKMLQEWVSDGHLRNFIDCVKTREETIAPFETAHRSISIAHLCNISIRLGNRKIKWDPLAEQITNDPTANRMLSRSMRKPWHL